MEETINLVQQTSVLGQVQSKPVKRAIRLRQVWLVAQWLSVDVAIGAVCSGAMICKLMYITPLPWVQLGILAVTVLVIYTVDHLWDVQQMLTTPVTGRHAFHWRFRKVLWLFSGILAGIVGIGSLLFLSRAMLYFGLGLASLVALYLWLVNYLSVRKGKKWFHKEICIAILYTAGIWGVAFVNAKQITMIHWLLALAFSLIALQNLLLFSCYELEEDICQAQRSVVQSWGQNRTKYVLAASFTIFIINALLIYYLNDDSFVQQVLCILCIMSAVLGLLFLFTGYFKKNRLYRPIGDGVFLLPGCLFLNHLLFN